MGKHWRSLLPLERNLHGHPLAVVMGETIRRSFIRTWMGENTGLECMFVHRTPDHFCQYVWMTLKMSGRSRIWLPCGRNWWKLWILTTTSFLDHVHSGNANRMKQLLNNMRRCLNRVFCWSKRKITGWEKSQTKTVALVVRHGKTCSKMRWAILWTGKQESGATLQNLKPLVWMIK